MANTHSADFTAANSEYFSLANASITGLFINGDLTVEWWQKMDDQSAQYTVCQLAGTGETEANNYIISINIGTDGSLKFFHEQGAGGNTDVSSSASIAGTGSWEHFAVVRDTANKVYKVYKDTVFQEDVSYTNNPTGGTGGDFAIGASFNGGSGHFNGQIDDMRIWDDIRTSTEISDNYQTELVGNETNLQGYWKFNNDAVDETSNNNDLTNNNTVVFTTDVAFTESTFTPKTMVIM